MKTWYDMIWYREGNDMECEKKRKGVWRGWVGRKKGKGNKIRKRQNIRSKESRMDEVKRRNKMIYKMIKPNMTGQIRWEKVDITHLAFFHVHVHQQLMAVRTLIRTYFVAASQCQTFLYSRSKIRARVRMRNIEYEYEYLWK
jgi:hypothetical protein